jgi:hypothetical protein
LIRGDPFTIPEHVVLLRAFSHNPFEPLIFANIQSQKASEDLRASPNRRSAKVAADGQF